MAIGWTNKSTRPAGRKSLADGGAYLSPEAKANRADLRESPYTAVPANESVHSKSTKRYGRNDTTGEQPAGPYRDQIAPSVAPIAMPRATEHTERVGWVNGKYVAPTFPNTGKHDPGHSSGIPGNTDAAQGQAWHASGGEFGKQSPHLEGTPRPGVSTAAPVSKLDRAAYVAPTKQGPSTK